MEHSLTDMEIRQCFDSDDDVGVMTYADCHQYPILEILNSYPTKAIIILVRASDTYGHWVAVFLSNGKEHGIHVFDSYGNSPDAEVWNRGVSKSTQQRLGQDAPYLLQQLYDSGCELYFNDHHYQSKCKLANGEPIATCGRHCVTRVMCSDLSCAEYDKFMRLNCERYQITPDEFVTFLTN